MALCNEEHRVHAQVERLPTSSRSSAKYQRKGIERWQKIEVERSSDPQNLLNNIQTISGLLLIGEVSNDKSET